MNFEDWYEKDETIIPNDIEYYDLKTAWNAAIDEALKVLKDNHISGTLMIKNGESPADIYDIDTYDKIIELKE